MKEEEIDVKIGTKEEKAWAEIKKRATDEISKLRREIEINRAIMVLASKKVQEEQKDLNKSET